MTDGQSSILVFDATGRQGGSVVNTLLKAGSPVRALVRKSTSEKAAALAARGVGLVQGDMSDAASIRSAMAGALGVFSVQTSSPSGEINDADEVRYGGMMMRALPKAGTELLLVVWSISRFSLEQAFGTDSRMT